MPTATGRAFTTGNFLSNLAALKAINFGPTDPAGTWFIVPNLTTGNVEIWVWQPASMSVTNETSVVRPDSIIPGSPGRCVQSLNFSPAQLGGILAAIAALTTTGLIERTAQGGVSTATVTNFAKTLLDDVDPSAWRTSLGLGNVAIRAIGTVSGTIRDAADAAYSNARTPTIHAATHAVGSADPITVFGYLALSTNSTLTASNERQLIDVNATASAITITLPSAAAVGSGWAVQIRKSDATVNLVTISRAGSDTINGATTLSLAVQHQSLILFSLGGTSWGVVAGFPGTLPANSLLGTGSTAGIAGAIPRNTFVFGDDWSKTIGASQTPNAVFTTSGFIDVYGAADSIFPAGITHINGFQTRHRNPTNSWGMQAGCQHNISNEFYFRTITGGTFNPWRRTWNDGNLPISIPSSSAHGSISVPGVKAAYAGIHFPGSADGQTMMFGAASRNSGVWSPTPGWHWFYNVGNFTIHSSDVVTEGSFIGLYKGLNSLPGYPTNRFPTVRTDFSTLYFSAGGVYSATMSSNGVWTAVSDKNKKTVVEKIDPIIVLNKIAKLPVNRYFFKTEDERITHIGTFAQDFWKQFECGGNREIINDKSPTSPDKMLAISDVAGVCLAGIQGLILEIAQLKKELKNKA